MKASQEEVNDSSLLSHLHSVSGLKTLVFLSVCLATPFPLTPSREWIERRKERIKNSNSFDSTDSIGLAHLSLNEDKRLMLLLPLQTHFLFVLLYLVIAICCKEITPRP